MKTETVSRVCGKCGAKISADARHGFCPVCVLWAGLDLLDDKDADAAGRTPMPPEEQSSTAAGLIPSEIRSTDHAKDIISAYKRGESQKTLTEIKPDLPLEIAHILLIDVVGYSKLLVNEEIELLQELNRIVRSTKCFRAAESTGKLTRVPTGDGMALLFFRSPEEPAQCALEISQALKDYPHIQLRMGVHSGPVSQVIDVNDKTNIAGAGINVAQRVMDCGDAGHILLSKRAAEDLVHYRQWQAQLHDLGECDVKHGGRLHVVNLYTKELGNPAVPEKLKAASAQRKRVAFRWLSLGAASLLAVIAVMGFLFLRYKRPLNALELAVPEKSIAVLPFENRSEDKANAYFAEGIQDEILMRLSKIADLKVISRTSTQHYKSAPENLREIARQLGVAHILEGSVQK